MLTQGKYCKIVERHMEPMLRQLRAASSDIRYDGDLVYLSGTTPDSRRLEAIGNLHSDGRPILGLDCRDLLEAAQKQGEEKKPHCDRVVALAVALVDELTAGKER